MKKFINETKSGTEKAVKIGSSVPSGSVGLSWFESQEVVPSNTIGIVDYSNLIKENKISEKVYGSSQVVYADELGILRKLDGSYNFQSNDISISDIPLSRGLESRRVDLLSVDSSDYVHYKYVSRHFISAPNAFSLSGENDFIESDYYAGISMKVVDKNGFEYIDESLDRKKYRILLEPYRTELNNLRPEVPHRIVVYLDSSIPDGLMLVYDKVESDSSGYMFNLELGYTESINAVPLYYELPEESFVIDRTTVRDRVFSVKKLDNKYSEIVNNSVSENGYQIVAPQKAFSDYRTYEGFNWRVIARLNSSVDQYLVDESIDINIRKTLNVGVLFSSLSEPTNAEINPYIFRRLEASPFNLFSYIFQNNNASEEADKNSADYWKVDIDDINLDIREYDILAWSPNSDITLNQAIRIRSFLERSKTLILDLSNSNLSDNAAAYIEGNLNRQASAIEAQELRLESCEVTDHLRNGAWNLMSGTDYSDQYYGIWGSLNIGTQEIVEYPSYKPFENSGGSFLNIVDDINNTLSPSVARIIPFFNNSDSVSRGNVLAVTFNLMNYCNNIYGESADYVMVDDNSDAILYPESDNRYPGIVEGPFKLLFNTCSYALYSLARSSRIDDDRSAIYSYVSTWYPSWTMNQDVLLEEEKSSIFLNTSQSTETTRYARDLIPGHDNMKEFIKNEFSNLSQYVSDRLNFDIDSIELFIEVTNPSVEIINSIKISEEQKTQQDLPSSYQLFKVLDNEAKAYAETLSFSASLNVPSSYGDYIIVDKPANYSKDVVLSDDLNVMGSLASYPFDLECKYSYGVPGEESYTYYDASLDIDYQMTLTATLREPIVETITTDPIPPVPGEPITSVGWASSILSSIDSGAQNSSPSVYNSNNIFPYTGDIDLGNKTSGWVQGNSGSYARYVQWVLRQSGHYSSAIDGYYGPVTAGAVAAFQRSGKQRYIDGIVDSETKWYLAKYIRDKDISPLRFIDSLAYDFARAAKNTVTASSLTSGKDYRKITFTGTTGPSYGEDYIFFDISNPPNEAIEKLVILTGSWGPDVTQITGSGFAATRNTDIPSISTHYKSTGPASYVNGTGFVVNLGGLDPASVKSGYIKVRGGYLGGIYGIKAEGFSISSIKIIGKSEGVPTPGVPGTSETVITGYTTKSVPITIDVDARDVKVVKGISAVNPANFDIRKNSDISAMLSQNLSKITVNTFNYNGINYSLGRTLEYYSTRPRVSKSVAFFDGGIVSISFDIPITGNLGSRVNSSSVNYALNKVYASADNSLVWYSGSSGLSNPISIAADDSRLVLSTASIYYGDAYFAVATKSLSNGYFLRSADISGIVYDDTRKTVNINDGVLLFCDSEGRKYGFPTSSEIQAAIAGQGNLDLVDPRLGSVFLFNNFDSSGMIYGFYDMVEKEFLGAKIDWIDLEDPNKDIYIAVAAIDADGDIFSDNDFIGASGSIKFSPIRIPLKYVAPVYSLVMNQPSAIKVAPVDAMLSRFDAWSLPVTRGYFEKKIQMYGNFEDSDWRNNYKGQTLTGIYSTSSLSENNSSKLYGRSSLDIYNESPIVIDDKTIRLRRTPVLAWNHPTNYASSIFGIIKPVLKVEKRESINSEWVEILYSDIRNIDCQSGVVQFKRRIIPGDSALIRVNYTIKSKNATVKRVGPTALPLNPVLDHNNISFGNPLFIYLMPKELYCHSASMVDVGSRERVSDYDYVSPINFTYNSDIFNKNSSSYDPLALLLAVIYVSDRPENIPPKTMDIRLRGGGVIQDIDFNKLINYVPEVLYNWDVYSPDTEAYTRGGYVVVRMPESVKDNFVDEREVYNIIKNNLTAGIVFELQDMNGKSWT